ncbi:zf-HC2 domain-containing protein [Marinobacter sp. C2H3]|uniref:zf-HC2 domain-containing protein n=1 Tax=Marinobacter sp. C2H3 TaxID=3119003 RepID=UPI00300EAA36
MLMCKDVACIASDYLDGNLNGSKRLSVKLHLMMCRHCRRFIGNLQESNRLLRAHSSGGADDELLNRVSKRVAEALVRQSSGKKPS